MLKQIPKAKYENVHCSKQMYKKNLAARKAVLDETNRQIDILYNAAALVLFRFHGWKDSQIIEFFREAENIGQQCSEDYDTSLIEMLWKETEIELMAEGCEKHWYEVSFLNSEMFLDRKALNQFTMCAFYEAQLVWVSAQVTASILLALYRVEGWKPQACKKFLDQLEDTKYEYDMDGEWLRHLAFEEAGVKLSETFWHVD